MTDRDTFAAAALTGLLAAPTDKDRSMDYWARLAYEAADAMLRERERTTNKAAPAAGNSKVPARPEMLRCCEVTHENVSASGTGRTTSGSACEPHADGRGGIPRCTDAPPDVTQPDNGLATSGRGHHTQEPVAWAVCDATWYHDVRLSQWTAEGYAAHLNAASGKRVCTTVPLYRQPQPSLTAEEREAVEGAIKWYDNCRAAATLRALLERLA
jgi:hypothetical protein